jgi:cell division protein DivIC
MSNLAYILDMNLLTHIFSRLRNKYIVAIAVFAVIMLCLDKNDVFTQLSRTRQLKELKESKEYYMAKISSEKGVLDGLRSNPATIEKFAREKHLMKRDNEDLYLIPQSQEKVNK